MMKKISRRSFLQVCGITAATAALTACGGGKTETAKKDDVHEAITFMAPYRNCSFISKLNILKMDHIAPPLPIKFTTIITAKQQMIKKSCIRKRI